VFLRFAAVIRLRKVSPTSPPSLLVASIVTLTASVTRRVPSLGGSGMRFGCSAKKILESRDNDPPSPSTNTATRSKFTYELVASKATLINRVNSLS